MDKGCIIIKAEVRTLSDSLFKKSFMMIIVLGLCLLVNNFKKQIADKYVITDSIFNADPTGIVSMIMIYIVLSILLILLLITIFRWISVFYKLKRQTTIDFIRERITIESYDFPFQKEMEEKKFNRIVGVDILQSSIDRLVNSGTLYVEYLVLSKNDSKLRGIEIPNVKNPKKMKDLLLNEQI